MRSREKGAKLPDSACDIQPTSKRPHPGTRRQYGTQLPNEASGLWSEAHARWQCLQAVVAAVAWLSPVSTAKPWAGVVQVEAEASDQAAAGVVVSAAKPHLGEVGCRVAVALPLAVSVAK